MKAKKKIDITGTLKDLPVGSQLEFKITQAKVTTVRSAANRLKAALGFHYTTSERGTKILVTRIA